MKIYEFVETDNRYILIIEYDTKAKMNRYLKRIAAIRKETVDDKGSQAWDYVGTFKASG